MDWLANGHNFVKHIIPKRVAALVNSPNIALKTRLLFLLNKCHSNLEKNKIIRGFLCLKLFTSFRNVNLCSF